jgi:excisionase family DNA binding protein
MSTATLTTRRNGGRTRAAVSFPAEFDVRSIYCRDGANRIPSARRTRPMIPDPAVRPVMTAEEAFAELGIDRSTGYKAIRDGTFPLPVIRVGRLIRVPTASLRRLLEIESGEGEAKGAAS